jgi:hypothetical protein
MNAFRWVLAFQLSIPLWSRMLLSTLLGQRRWKGKNKFDYSIGATLYMVGDASIDQTSQGVRTTGEFDQHTLLFLGGTLRYVF